MLRKESQNLQENILKVGLTILEHHALNGLLPLTARLRQRLRMKRKARPSLKIRTVYMLCY